MNNNSDETCFLNFFFCRYKKRNWQTFKHIKSGFLNLQYDMVDILTNGTKMSSGSPETKEALLEMQVS